MRKASDLAMAPYARAERGYLRILPAALSRPAPILLVAGVAFALTLAVVPLLGTDLIPQLAQDRFETVSYTHLDVYKRQALSGAHGQPVRQCR